MLRHITEPSIIESAGTKPKRIEEYIGRINSLTDKISIARMASPPGWEEPAQTPEFEEFTLVLKGAVYVKTAAEEYIIRAGQAFVASPGETVQYSTPEAGGAEYIAVCLPAFSPDTVHRDE